jgi:hypothetical protein
LDQEKLYLSQKSLAKEDTMPKPTGDMLGGANKFPAAPSSEKYTNHVGVGAGDTPGGGSADAVGTDRGCYETRAANMFNPQNTHEVVQSEYKRVPHAGPTEFAAEPKNSKSY